MTLAGVKISKSIPELTEKFPGFLEQLVPNYMINLSIYIYKNECLYVFIFRSYQQQWRYHFWYEYKIVEYCLRYSDLINHNHFLSEHKLKV